MMSYPELLISTLPSTNSVTLKKLRLALKYLLYNLFEPQCPHEKGNTAVPLIEQ
jgi:hypothetical protein